MNAKKEDKVKVKKRYYHVSSYITYITPDGRTFCSQCGAELDKDLKSEVPCSTPTAATLHIDDFCFEISVWNCVASLIVFKEIDSKREYYELHTDEKTMKKINELAVESVCGAGGAINFSGIYPVSDKLKKLLIKGLEKGKIKIHNEKGGLK